MFQTLHIFVHFHHIHCIPEHPAGSCHIPRQPALVRHQIPFPLHCPVPVCNGLPVLLIFLPAECPAAVGIFKHHLHFCRVMGMGAEIVQMLLVVYLQNIPHHPVIPHPPQLHPECLHMPPPASAIVEPGIVRAGLPNMHAPLWKAPGAALPAHPEKLPGRIPVPGGFQKHLPVIGKIGLKETGIMLHDLLQGLKNIHVPETGVGAEVVSIPLQPLPKLCHHLFPCPFHRIPVVLVPSGKIPSHIPCTDAQPSMAVRHDKVHHTVHVCAGNPIKQAVQVFIDCRFLLSDLLNRLTGQVKCPQIISAHPCLFKGINFFHFHIHLHPPLLVSFFLLSSRR